jgi:hypothetical protein
MTKIPGARAMLMSADGLRVIDNIEVPEQDEPMGLNDEHTLLGAIWGNWGRATPAMLRMLRGTFGWKIEPDGESVGSNGVCMPGSLTELVKEKA